MAHTTKEIVDAYERGQKDMRERCAKEAESMHILDNSPTGFGRGMSRDIAYAIRKLELNLHDLALGALTQ